MPSIRLMGFAAGALFLLSSTGNAQSLQAPGKAMPTAQAPSKVLPQPQAPGKGMPAAYGAAGYTPAGSTGYYGGGYTGGTAGNPGGYRLRSARLQPGRPRWAGIRDRGAARPGRRRLRTGALTVHGFSNHLRGRAGLRLRANSGAVPAAVNSRGPRPAGEEIRSSTSSAGRHSGGDPAP